MLCIYMFAWEGEGRCAEQEDHWAKIKNSNHPRPHGPSTGSSCLFTPSFVIISVSLYTYMFHDDILIIYITYLFVCHPHRSRALTSILHEMRGQVRVLNGNSTCSYLHFQWTVCSGQCVRTNPQAQAVMTSMRPVSRQTLQYRKTEARPMLLTF